MTEISHKIDGLSRPLMRRAVNAEFRRHEGGGGLARRLSGTAASAIIAGMQGKLISVARALEILDASARPFVTRGAVRIGDARNLIVAEDVVAEANLPPTSVALRAGYAVASAETLDASAMSPVMLAHVPARVLAGEALPAGTDAVLPLHGVSISGEMAEAIAVAAPGDDVRRAGEDAARGACLLEAGAVIGKARLAALAAAGVEAVTARVVRVALPAGHGNAPGEFMGRLVAAFGARIADAGEGAALVVGREPDVAESRYSVALRPGLGEVRIAIVAGQPPVLTLPCRADVQLAAAYALLLPLIDRLTERTEPRVTVRMPIGAKIAVQAGVTNVALVARDGERWNVLAAGDLPLGAISRADGLAVLGPECEGLAPETGLSAHPLI